MDVRQLEYFVHVANTLNITHAAMRAHVSQPALSRQIRLLEQELGTKLFKRKARGVVLTNRVSALSIVRGCSWQV